MAEEQAEADFVVAPKIYRLVWSEGERKGLVVRARALPMARFLELAPRIDALSRTTRENLNFADIPALMEPFRVLGGYLVSWNLKEEVDGVITAVPCTYEGLMSQEVEFIKDVLQAWMQATGGVSAPLESASPGGGTPPPDLEELLASIPMTAAQQS